MRIVLDLQAIQAPPNRDRGIGRVYRSFVREIIKQRGPHEVLVVISGLLYDYAEEIWDQLSDILPIDCFHVWHGIEEVSWHQSTQDEVSAYCRQINRILYEAFLVSLRPDIVLFGNFCDGYHDSSLLPLPGSIGKIPQVMICHDLIPLVYPRLYEGRDGTGFIDFYRLQLAYLKQAAHIFTFSRSVEQDVVRFLGYPAEAITMTSLGFTPLSGEESKIPQVEEVCYKYRLQKPFILFVSAQDPRKNHLGVIEAFARLPSHLRENYQLVFAGSSFADQSRLYEMLDTCDLPRSALSIVVNPSDAELKTLYKLAHLGIFPSLYEGFGLGILESMAFGLPVIASNTSAMPEVMGREDALFDPNDTESMAAKIEEALTDEDFRKELVVFGLDRVTKWDWEACASKAVRAFERIHMDAAGRAAQTEMLAPKRWVIDQVRSLAQPMLSPEKVEALFARIAVALDLTYPTIARAPRSRILVDISEFIHYDYNTGIQRVIKCVVAEMARQLEHMDLDLIYSRANGVGYYYARNLKKHLLDGKPRLPFEHESNERVRFFEGDILFHSELTKECVKKQQFYLQALRRIGVKVMFLVYDLIPITHPAYHVGHTKKAMIDWLAAIVQSDKVICISQATESDVRACVNEYSLPAWAEVEVDWFHLGGDFQSYSLSSVGRGGNTSRVLSDFRSEQISCLKGQVNFLAVGTIEPRKSHVDMIKTMEVLWAKGVNVNLVFVGKIGWLDQNNLDFIKNHPELGNRFFLFNNLSDSELNDVYRLSSCLLYFSKVEGFGLPLIEAAQHDVPIIVRDAPIFREVCGDHAFYFPDDLTPAEIAPYVERWLSLYADGQHPRSTDLPWLTWQESVSILLEKIFAAAEPRKRLVGEAQEMRQSATIEASGVAS